jgi:hypothetical protein
LGKNERNFITNVLGSSCRVSDILYGYKKDVNGSPNTKFQENLSRRNEMFHAEREEKTNKQT